jgi:hypothetical protein
MGEAMRRILTALATAVLMMLASNTVTNAAVPTRAEAAAAVNHTVTLVNHTGRKVWIGSTVNADGSKKLVNLPILKPGQSATVTIPETAAPGHWRGKFFAREDCTGKSGSTFHCRLGDCGKFAQRCAKTEQDVSLAEFNFDPSDNNAPWYDVSYVNAFSVPITITPKNAVTPAGGGCATAGCSKNLLPNCPAGNLTRWPSGKPMLCTNPSRDAQTAYSDMIGSRCPKAYGWSDADKPAGNKVMQQCSKCSGFTVAFHAAS